MLSPHLQPSTTPSPHEVRYPRMTEEKGGKPIHPDFSALFSSSKRSHKLTLLLQKTLSLLHKQLLLTTGCGVEITGGTMFPNPVLRQTWKQTVSEVQRCFVHRPYQPNERRLQRNHLKQRLEIGGPQSPGQRWQSQQTSQRKRTLGPHRIVEESATALTRRPMLQRESYGNPELNQQEGSDPEES